MQKLSRSLIALGGLAALAACGDDVSVTPPTPPAVAVVGVTVSPQTLTLRIGESATLGVSVETTGGAATTVTWTSSTPSVATVSAAGAVTAVAAGNTTVRATSTADASKSGAAQVTVLANAVRSVTVSPQSLSLQVGQTATPVATVDRDAGVAGTVTWASNAAGVATVSTAGLITAVAPGTAIITATSTVDATKSAALAVTVVPVPNNLIGLSVAPTNANLGVGGTVQLVPSATTSGSPAVTYTYASSNTGVATVSNSGLVTAVGNGTAVITTTATTSTNSLSVATTINVASASVSILSITTGALNTPVNIANVAGQIEVTMNISAGNQTLDSVRVRLGNQPAATQGFTVNGAPNAPVTLSINTAAYTINADSSSTVRYLNGQTGVTADLFVRGASGPTASNTITINLNNTDTFHARWTLPATSATSATGFIWYGGPNTFTRINAIPVMYSGNTVTSATIHMDNANVFGQDAACLVNGTTTGAVTVTDATAPFTGDFSCSGVTLTAVQPGVLNSLRADGNAGPGAVGAVNGAGHTILFANAAILTASNAAAPNIAPVRIDVQAPSFAVAPSLTNALVAGQITGWVNAATVLGSTTAVFTTANVTDAGVGLNATRTLTHQYQGCPFVSTTASKVWVSYDGTGNTIPECATDFTGGATPGPYEARAQETDRLGNLGTSGNSGRFGVDKTAPTTRWGTATSAANSVSAVSRTFQSEAFDDRAGFQQNAAHTHFLARASGATPTGVCAVGTTPTGGIGTAFVTAPACGRVADNVVYPVLGDGFNQGSAILINTAGYATYSSAWTDQAGNSTVLGTRIVAVDPALPSVTGLNVPAGITATAFPAFALTYTDDVEGTDYSFGLNYPAVGVTRYPRRTQNTRFDDTISTPGQFTFTSPYGLPFVRRIEIVCSAAAAPSANCAGANQVQPSVAGTNPTDATAKPDQVQGTAFDVLGSASAPFSSSPFVAILAGNVQNGTNFEAWNGANAANAIGTWSIIPLAAGFNAGAGLKAQVVTTTNSTNAPFARVDFYRVNAGEWYYFGSSTSAVPGNNTTNRFWTYLFSGTPANTPFNTTAQAGASAGDVFIAVGVTSAGDGLSTLSTILVP